MMIDYKQQVQQKIMAQRLTDENHEIDFLIYNFEQNFQSLQQKSQIQQRLLLQHSDQPNYQQILQMLQQNCSFYKDSLRDTLTKTIKICKHYKQRQRHSNEIILQFQGMISQKNQKLEGLSEEAEYLKNKLNEMDRDGLKLSAQVLQLQQKIMNLQQERQNEKQQIQLQQNDYENEKQIGKMYFVQVDANNKNLTQQIVKSEGLKLQLQQNIKSLTESIFMLNQQLVEMEVKLQWEVKKKNQLYQEIKQKNQKIYQLESQIYQLKEVLRNPFQRLQPNENIYKSGFDQIASEFQSEASHFQPKIKLSEDIVNHQNPNNISHFNQTVERKLSQTQIHQYPLREESNHPPHSHRSRSFLVHKEIIPKHHQIPPSIDKTADLPDQISILQNTEKPIKLPKVKIMDPYFSHFILTSQSVKIRQDCQELLNIDVKPFYKEMLEKRIPMHLWDQWIRNKLKEVAKQNKNI